MYQDLINNNKVNIVNVLYFIAFTFLTLYKKKTIEKPSEQISTQQISNIKKDIILEIGDEQELQLTKTFKK